MITSWADEEDKANAKYDAIRGKNKQTTGGGSGNNGNQGGRNNNNNYSGPNRKRKPDNTVAAIQRPAKENLKKNSGSFKDLLKEKWPWHLDGNHTTEQCYQLRRALKSTPEPPHPHDKKGKKTTETTVTSRNPTRPSTSSSVDYPADGSKRLPVEKS
jgi:hypothetical protein